MDKKFIAGILFGIFAVVALAFAFPLSESNIPPTDSIQTIFVDTDPNDNVTAFTWDGNATFISGAGITILADYANSELTFSSGAGSATWEQLTNVTDTFCTTGQVRKAVGNQWICADDNIGDTLSLEQLINVTDIGCASGQVIKASGGGWLCANDDNTGAITTMESLTNVTDIGCASGQILSVVGNTWQCTTQTSGATTLNGLSDVTITSVAHRHILQYSGALTQWVNKLFSINTLSASNDIFITGINNQTGVITTKQFSVNTIDAGYNSRIKSINNQTGLVTFDSIDHIDTTTCSGTDKVSAINNVTGVVTCSADQTGSGGSGIPKPPKKWGELIPKSASTDTIGLVAGCTILATASYVYDTTDNSGAILSTTAVTDGVNGGIHCTSTNFNVFRGDQNAYLYSKWEANKITTNRLFIGFTSTATLLPNNADTILDNLVGVGLCIRTTDTIYQFCRNDGDATTDYVSTGVTEDAGGVHYFEVYTTDGGSNWCGKIDGGTATCWSTEIPTATTRLYAESTGETDGGATAILWTQYLFYVENDK